jgi:predicted nucleic acid-binding protein
MNDEVFIDTNVLVYVLTDDLEKTVIAEAVLEAGGMISVQVLSELASVASKKLKMPWNEIEEALGAIRACCSKPRPLQVSTHESALRISANYGFAYYDSLIVASALEADCKELLTEGLQAGQLIDGRLTIVNPFASKQ